MCVCGGGGGGGGGAVPTNEYCFKTFIILPAGMYINECVHM